MKQKQLALVFCCAAWWMVAAQAITLGPFGPQGEGGSKNGQSFRLDPGGSVYELDAFLRVGDLDLNGSQLGPSAQLSRHPLPAGLGYNFSSVLSADLADLVLTYTFTNATDTAFSNLRFFVLLDAEIDQAVNTFFNEYGTLKGVAGHGAADGSPDQWQIDEPGFLSGTLYRNLFLGALSNSNAIPQNAPNDVALALGFSLGDLAPGSATTVRVMISENGRSLGSLALIQRDLDPASKTFITLSGGLLPALAGGVFVDANANGRFDPGEGLAQVTLRLLSNGSALQTATTDADGRYSFSVAPPGAYSVRVDPATLPSGAVLAAVQDGATANPFPITLVGGGSKTLNWGYHQHPLLGGRIYVDANTNAVFDPGPANPGEQALANVTVGLTTPTGIVAQTTTDSSGLYGFGNASFPDPSPGNYVVTVDTNTLPPGVSLRPSAASQVPTNAWPETLTAGATNRLDWLVYRGLRSSPPQFYLHPWVLYRTHGSLLGTVNLANTNPPGSGPAPEPFWLGLHSSSNFFYPYPAGVGSNGLPYVDLTAAVKARLGGGALNPGQTVILTNAIEVYSRTRGAPPDSLFEWVR